MSPGSCMPVFDVHPNHQNRLDRFQGCYDEANARAASQLAAGSIPSPPFASTSSPSLDIYSGSFDQWSSLLNSDISSDLHSSYGLGFSVSDPSFSYGSQDSASSSPNLSYVTLTSSLTPSTGLPRTLARPRHQWHHPWGTIVYCILLPQTCSQALSERARLVVKISSFQLYLTRAIPLHGPDHRIYLTLSLLCSIYTRPLPCPGHWSQAMCRVLQTNHCRAPWPTVPAPSPSNFIASPITVETTALGLYYSGTSQSPDVPRALGPLLSTQAENNASVPCVVQHVPPPAPPSQNWTFRAVDPASKVSRSKCVQSDEACTSDHVLTTAAPTFTSHGANVEPVVECGKCGYLQLTKRMGDFRRHLKKHEADHLSRVVCCGVPPTHPAAASLRSGHLTHWYDGHLFYGGCGRSYSRMDALQRHLKKSGCISGSARDHRSWRKLYFREKTGRPHKSAQSSVSSESQNSSVLSPIYSPPRASSSLL
jgi:hypothetical protein